MKSRVILLFTLGLASVYANSAEQLQTTSSVTPTLSQNESKQTEETPNKGETEQNNTTKAADTTTEASPSYGGADVEIIIEETYNPEKDFVPQTFMYPEEDLSDNLYQDTLLNKLQDEIMETAEGFVPIPIFRRRQSGRRRVATRRHGSMRPRRRPYFFYPYYSHYRPLRYY